MPTTSYPTHNHPLLKPALPKLRHAESDLLEAVDELVEQKYLLNPVEEKEIGHSPYQYPGGDKEIIAEVKVNKS
ncbi:hypothetical protein JVU11DRAFT_6744 [Chiua virens]|nr:hypothetical protein JVU11DRAFT_12530 [Chiua virens]KAG9312371.1 hypothetical protein JVU11DRAFT_6744 [Chiua virens]